MANVATNRQAPYRYNLLDKWECGLVLTGTEVKSYAMARRSSRTATHRENGEVWLHNVHIPPYGPATRENHEPERPRKLLMHRREIERLIGKTKEKGLTLVPTRLYFKDRHAKVEIALARARTRSTSADDQGARDEARDGAQLQALVGPDGRAQGLPVNTTTRRNGGFGRSATGAVGAGVMTYLLGSEV